MYLPINVYFIYQNFASLKAHHRVFKVLSESQTEWLKLMMAIFLFYAL